MKRSPELRKRRAGASLHGGVCGFTFICVVLLFVSARQWRAHTNDLGAALDRASAAKLRLDIEHATQSLFREQLRQAQQPQPPQQQQQPPPQQQQPPQPQQTQQTTRRGAPLSKPWWHVAADCSAYDVACPTNRRGRYAPYPLESLPTDVGILPVLVDAAAFSAKAGSWTDDSVAKEDASRARLRNALASKQTAPLSTWWRAVTASDAAAISAAQRPQRASYMLNASAPWESRIRAVLPAAESYDRSTFIKGCVAWTMTNKAYGEAMLHEVVDMASTTAGFEDRFFVVALDLETLRAAAAAGFRAVSAPDDVSRTAKNGNERLRHAVQHSKYFVSLWLVRNHVDFFFFEMDVWFVRPAQDIVDALARSPIVQDRVLRIAESTWPHRYERGVVGPLQMIVAAAQNRPTAANIGVFAAVASDATREFFEAWLAEALTRPSAHDQLLFHHLLTYSRMTADGKVAEGKPRLQTPKKPVFHAFIPVFIGACSILPIPNEKTVFVHTLGNTPLKAQHGKMVHAKELAVWHGMGSPSVGGSPLATYYGAGAHSGTRYVALDGPLGGSISLCDETGYHNVRFVKAKVALLVLVAAMTDRVVILPKVVIDYHAYFLWTLLDVESLVPLTIGWRETNFVANRRSWHNRTHPWRSVAALNLEREVVGIYRQDEAGAEAMEWFKLRRDKRSPSWQSTHLDELSAALNVAGDAEVLLVNAAFISGEFVAALANCATFAEMRGPQCKGRGMPSLLAAVYYKLKWCVLTFGLQTGRRLSDRIVGSALRDCARCGKDVNLKRHVSETFQGFDCFGVGDSAGPHQQALDQVALHRLGQ
ncbi:hypothetical protein M885DRAFT_525622 [Pelagophyceae sp. CCMP2097]|nr:hypothetical protein M885DRAFT_525622 [Pelagophyceae sp. CCMP2097]